MLQKAEAIYHKANELVRRCGTRDTLRIASEIGIYIHQIGDFKELLGMYSYQHKERHILILLTLLVRPMLKKLQTARM